MAGPDWNFHSTDIAGAVRRISGGSDDPRAVDWRGVRVAHIDTGVRDHPVFGGLTGGSSWVKILSGVNYMEPGEAPVEPPHEQSGTLIDDAMDSISDLSDKGVDGHGTRTLSVLCGDGNYRKGTRNSRVGLLPGLPVVPYRVTDTVLLAQRTVLINIAKAITHAVDTDCKVISMSLGFPIMRSKAVGKAIDHAYSSGVIVVAAGGQFIDKVTYPGRFSRTIGVGGHTPERKIWHLGHYSKTMQRFVDVWAPSTDIIRANPGWADDGRLYDDVAGEGTSYGTVHVAAAAALWLRHHGENKLAAHYPKGWQRVEAFRKALRDGSVPLVEPRDRQPVNGTGRLNIDATQKKKLAPRVSLAIRPRAETQIV